MIRKFNVSFVILVNPKICKLKASTNVSDIGNKLTLRCF